MLPFNCMYCCSSCFNASGFCCLRHRLAPRSRLRLLHLLHGLLLHHLQLLRHRHQLLLLLDLRRNFHLRHRDQGVERKLGTHDLGGDLLDVARTAHHLALLVTDANAEPYCDLSCCAPSVSSGSVAPRMMSDRPIT